MDPDANPNPIVALAMRLKAKADVTGAIDSATPAGERDASMDAAASLESFGQALAAGTKKLNSILGRGVTYVRLEKPLRLRLRFKDERIALDLDEARQLVVVAGKDLDGEYQFDTSAEAPVLINLSKLSTEAGYGEPLTPSMLLKTIAQGAELPRPKHLDEPGPLRF